MQKQTAPEKSVQQQQREAKLQQALRQNLRRRKQAVTEPATSPNHKA